MRFLKEGEPISNKLTQINPSKRNLTSIPVNSRTSTSKSVNPVTIVNSRKSLSIPVNPHRSTVGVLMDRSPSNPSYTAQVQDIVNTVGPVPMAFGREPNTFPQSAAHVLNINHIPSASEGVTIYKYMLPLRVISSCI